MRILLMVLTCATLIPAATHAQRTSPAALEAGRRALELSLPSGGGGDIGLWWVRSPATQLGLSAAFGYRHQQQDPGDNSQSLWTFTIGPALKRHILVMGPIVPHWRAGLQVGMSGGSGSTPESSLLSASGGFGVDWFPVDRVSVGGHMGLRTAWSHSTNTTPTGDVTRDTFAVATFRSGLVLQLFF